MKENLSIVAVKSCAAAEPKPYDMLGMQFVRMLPGEQIIIEVTE